MSPDLTLTFGAHPITIIMDEQGTPWWIADEVCAALAIKNSRDAIARLDADEKGVGNTDTPGGPQQKATINESGLYSLILRSRKPEAKRFKRWVTHEVLPAIRKTGSYSHPAPASRTELDRRRAATARITELEAQLARRAEQVSALVAELDRRAHLTVPEADLSALTEQVAQLAGQVAALTARLDAPLALPAPRLADGRHPLGKAFVVIRAGVPVELHARCTAADDLDDAAAAFGRRFPGFYLWPGCYRDGAARPGWICTSPSLGYVAQVFPGAVPSEADWRAQHARVIDDADGRPVAVEWTGPAARRERLGEMTASLASQRYRIGPWKKAPGGWRAPVLN